VIAEHLSEVIEVKNSEEKEIKEAVNLEKQPLREARKPLAKKELVMWKHWSEKLMEIKPTVLANQA